MRRLAAAFFFASFTAATAIAATPGFGFIPTQIGQSFTYRYETSTARSIVTLTLTAPDRLTVTFTPETGQPFAVAEAIGANGAFEAISTRADAAVPSYATSQPSQSPYDGRSAAGQYSRHRGGGQNQPPRQNAQRPAQQVPSAFAAVASMLATLDAPGISQRSWLFTPSPGAPPITMNLKETKANGQTIVVADGTGYGTALHIEATLYGNTFTSARGSEKQVTYGVDPSQQPTTTWTLTAFAKQPR